jgi:hypothetical protein
MKRLVFEIARTKQGENKQMKIIILIGMPGADKRTIGVILSKYLSLEKQNIKKRLPVLIGLISFVFENEEI